MGKNQPQAPVAALAPRVKTRAQVLKAQQNIEAAAKRLAGQQARAKLARQLRERDTELTGSDDQVIEQYLDMVFLECAFAIAEIETAKAEAAEAAYVKAAFTSRKWVVVRLWDFLAGRKPTYALVKRFFAKGLPFGPATVKEAA